MLSVQILALSIALASGGETVLLDFHASWCAPCRSMQSTIDELEQAGYPIRKVDIDQGRGVAAQYNVESIPCYVLLVDGKEAGRLTGAVRRGELMSLFSKAGVGPGTARATARGQSPDPPVHPVSLPAEAAGHPLSRPRFSPPGSAGDQPARAALAATSRPTTQDLIRASVRLTVADPKGLSHGSGTLIDARKGEALVLTCGHIFRDSQGKGEITVDLFGDNAPQKVPGKLIAFDLTRDIALVSIRPGAPVGVARVASKEYRMTKGDKVTTVGCNNGGQATAIESRITAINKFLGPPNVQVAGLPVEGRSGGGLFTADGQVIGVCNAADPTDNEGLYAALAAIQAQLDQANLTAIYDGPAPREQALAAASTPDAQLASLNDAERAMLAQVGKQSDSAEVICIVRSLANPTAKSEVITLDRASSAFLKQLAADRQAQEGRHLTSLDVRTPDDDGERVSRRDSSVRSR
jgi:thiol-disulfide isomerase/thioredoxin